MATETGKSNDTSHRVQTVSESKDNSYKLLRVLLTAPKQPVFPATVPLFAKAYLYRCLVVSRDVGRTRKVSLLAGGEPKPFTRPTPVHRRQVWQRSNQVRLYGIRL